jgi:serine/threonine protein kinase
MELNDWIINKHDLHYITKKQFKTIEKKGLKAVGDYLCRGRKIAGVHFEMDEDLMIIGKSNHYTVYLCEWRGLLVAVKRLDLQQTDEKPAAKLTRHLKDEIAILVKMHHPNIVQILGITLEPFQIILEYFPMRDLNYFQLRHHSLLSCWKFSASLYRTKYRWSIDILLALIYLHERRPESVIHRDLKPSNVLITNDGSLKITDFGLSKLHTDYYEMLNSSDQNLDSLVESHNQKFDTFDIGTYWYMSPEVARYTPYDNKMDIWSLGLILYEIWEEKRISTIMESPETLIKYNDTRHEWIRFSFRTNRIIRSMILQCLSLNPDERPTVRNLMDSLMKINNRSYCCYS